MKDASSGMTIEVLLVACVVRMLVEWNMRISSDSLVFSPLLKTLYETCFLLPHFGKWKDGFMQNNLKS